MEFIAFILVSFILGLSISCCIDIKLSRIERLFFSCVVGHVVSVWITYLLSYALGLNISTYSLSVIICLLLAFFILVSLQAFSLDALKKLIAEKTDEDEKMVVFSLLFVVFYLVFLNLWCVLRPHEGSLYGALTIYGDCPFHASVITSFVYRDNFPPYYPQLLNYRMHYPVLMDFYSAMLMIGGLDLRSSIIIPNILFQASFFSLFYSLGYRLTSSKKIGILSIFLLIFSGNLGFLYAFEDISEMGFMGWITNLPKTYSGAFAGEFHDIYLGNLFYCFLMPQRTGIFGMAVSFAIYILLFHSFSSFLSGRIPKKELILSGILTGALPHIHGHSFLCVLFVSFVLILILSVEKIDKKMFGWFALFLMTIVILSLPQVLSMSEQIYSSEGFFVFYPGWTEENRSFILSLDWSFPSNLLSIVEMVAFLTKFWLLNTGAFSFLFILGFLKSRKETKFFYLPFFLLFLLANVMKFQPWYFDNYKVFVHWYSISVVLSSVAIERIARCKVGVAVLVCLLFLCTISGFLTHIKMMEESCRIKIWDSSDIEISEWVRDNTPQESVILTGSVHNHPIPALSGRQTFLGFEGWLWSHGVDWSLVTKMKREEINMFEGNHTLVSKYGIDYVCIGPYERYLSSMENFRINTTAFDDMCAVEYDGVLDGRRWIIYRCS